MPSTHANAGIAARMIAVKRDAKIKSFAEALDFFRQEHPTGPASIGTEVVVGQNTDNVKLRILATDRVGFPTEIGVKLYDTVIVAYRNDETFTTNSGGFLTPTTCCRIEQFTPWGYCHRGNRTILLDGKYADKHANRFSVTNRDEIVGPTTEAPKIRRKSSTTPHGTLRWMIDDDGHVYSLNDKYPNEIVFPLLDYEAIGRDDQGNYTGDYTAPLKYDLVREKQHHGSLNGLRGLAKSDVPLDLANKHRELWGMPPIDVIES